MNYDATSDTPGATDEPELTRRNSATVNAEEALSAQGADETRTPERTVPTSYGDAGGVAPQADESSGENGSGT